MGADNDDSDMVSAEWPEGERRRRCLVHVDQEGTGTSDWHRRRRCLSLTASG